MSNIEKQLSSVFGRHWWTLLLRGILAIAFGILTWQLPGISLAVLIMLFGAFVLADGILGLVMAIAGRKEYEDWWALLLWGLVGIAIGGLTFIAPAVTGLALLFFIAAWAITTGVLEIVAAVRLRREIKGEWLLILTGLLSVVFGVFLMARPGAGALALVWLIGGYAILFGLLLVTLAFKTRSLIKELARG
jgi:uncharacterized membrane protein HdeD (DUF308 family)